MWHGGTKALAKTWMNMHDCVCLVGRVGGGGLVFGQRKKLGTFSSSPYKWETGFVLLRGTRYTKNNNWNPSKQCFLRFGTRGQTFDAGKNKLAYLFWKNFKKCFKLVSLYEMGDERFLCPTPGYKNLTRFSLFCKLLFKLFCFLCFMSSVSFITSYTAVKPSFRLRDGPIEKW